VRELVQAEREDPADQHEDEGHQRPPAQKTERDEIAAPPAGRGACAATAGA
jgi:hypothetical protein